MLEKDNANLTKCSLNSMSCVRKLYKDKGISDEIAETISHGINQILNVNMTHTGNNGYSFVLKGCVIPCVPL